MVQFALAAATEDPESGASKLLHAVFHSVGMQWHLLCA